MKSLADLIWKVPAYLPYVQPRLTPKLIASAERQIGSPLPAEYLDLLKRQNGGYIRYSLPDSVHDVIWGIGPRYPSILDHDWDEVREDVSYPLDGLVPFDGDGHWYLCLDYRRNSSEAEISYVDVECDRESVVAPTFRDYLAMLVRDDLTDALVFETDLDMQGVLSVLAPIVRAPFSEPDTYAHGYPTCRAAVGSQESHEWVFVSPNEVPRGFVRRNDPDYDELCGLLPGTGLRYPEIPARSYLVSTTDGVRIRFMRGCRERGVRLRPLSEFFPGTDAESS